MSTDAGYSAFFAALSQSKFLDNIKKVHKIGAQALDRNPGSRTERRDENNVEGQGNLFSVLNQPIYKPIPPEA